MVGLLVVVVAVQGKETGSIEAPQYIYKRDRVMHVITVNQQTEKLAQPHRALYRKPSPV